MTMGRPTDYTEELADLICEGIAEKIPLARLCEENDKLPKPRTIYNWLRTHAEFLQNYTRAKEDQADYLAEECLDIADDAGIEPADKRIRVDTRKWLASKFKPKKYGDKQQIDIADKTDKPDEEELNSRIEELIKKQNER